MISTKSMRKKKHDSIWLKWKLVLFGCQENVGIGKKKSTFETSKQTKTFNPLNPIQVVWKVFSLFPSLIFFPFSDEQRKNSITIKEDKVTCNEVDSLPCHLLLHFFPNITSSWFCTCHNTCQYGHRITHTHTHKRKV